MASTIKPKTPKGGVRRDGYICFDGRVFVGERILADGCQFSDCSFTDCTLVYCGGKPFILTGSGGVVLEIAGSAQNTLDQLRAFHSFGYGDFVEKVIDSIRNPSTETVN